MFCDHLIHVFKMNSSEMYVNDIFIRRAACLRPLPMLIKSKLDNLVLSIKNDNYTNDAVIIKCQKILSYIDTLTDIEYLNSEDIEKIQHGVFLAELQILTGIRNVAIETINDSIKIIDNKIMTNLLMRKRLRSTNEDDLGTLDVLPWTARLIVLDNLV